MTTLPLIRVPEFIIHDGLQKALKFIREDYKAVTTGLTPDETKAWLYQLINGVSFQKYDYWEQAKEVFFSGQGNPRHLEIDLMFNRQRDSFPTIHITTPSDNPGINGLSNDEGYQDDIVSNNGSQTNSVFTRRYKGVYDVVITTDNSNEAILISHIIRALLMSLTVHFSLKGLENLSLSSGDLTPYQTLTPNAFTRIVRMNLEYETSTMSFEKGNILTDATFNGTAVNNVS